MGEFITYEVEDRIGVLTINRPEKRNAMTFAMNADFGRAVGQASEDDACRVLIVTGSGGSFCAGTDLSDLSGRPTDRRGGNAAPDRAEAWWPLSAVPKPVIAAVDGPAVGMGAEFTSQADVRICSNRARFAWNFAHRGLVPDTGAGTWLLPRLIGVPATLRLLYSGDFLYADEALRIGYVIKVVAPELLLEAAKEEARQYLKASPFSQRLIKELLYKGLERDRDEHMRHHMVALQQCFRSEDHKEGVASFLEKRPANFTGR